MRVPLVVLALVALQLACARAQDLPSASAFIVVDGDTIRSPAGVRYRLLELDAPETFFARCDAELALGMKAKARLEQILASGTARLVESGRIDKYRRSLATLTVNGRDVAEIMIAEHLARPYHGERRKGWCDGAADIATH